MFACPNQSCKINNGLIRKDKFIDHIARDLYRPCLTELRTALEGNASYEALGRVLQKLELDPEEQFQKRKQQLLEAKELIKDYMDT